MLHDDPFLTTEDAESTEEFVISLISSVSLCLCGEQH